MTIGLPHTFLNHKAWPVARFVFPAALLVLTLSMLTGYLKDAGLLLYLGMAAVYATAGQRREAPATRYAVAAAILLLATFLVPVKTLLWLTIAAGFFYWMEGAIASVPVLGVAAVLVSSPAFQYAAAVFSFPIRMQLAKAVGGLFALFSSNIKVAGNTIVYSGHPFDVDPACMGLHLLSVSLLLGIVLIGLLQRKAGKTISTKNALLYLAVLFVLNIAANLLRMMILIQFAIPPQNNMHDVVGLCCLLVYVCLPACYIAKQLVKKARVTATVTPTRSRYFTVVQAVLLVGLMAASWRVTSTNTFEKFTDKETVSVPDYTAAVYGPGMIKLENSGSLIYLKFIRGFYDTEHNPTICWKGSGYEFKEVKEQPIVGATVYTALLTKEGDKLYTAWWYGNGTNNSHRQWDWRWDMLKGSTGYALINVTASSEAALLTEVQQLLANKTLSPFFIRP